MLLLIFKYFEWRLLTESNQLEDPRLQWRQEQQSMLKEYLVVANDDLEVNIYTLSY